MNKIDKIDKIDKNDKLQTFLLTYYLISGLVRKYFLKSIYVNKIEKI
jgi:hypothetical protein